MGHGSQVIFDSLTNRDFRFLWFSNLAASFAMQMQMVGRGWLIYDMTHSPVKLAIVMMVWSLPMMIFSPLGGVAADRLPKKPVMLLTQSLNALSTLLFAIIVISGNVSFWHFIGFGLFNGAVMAFSLPSRQAIVPELVDSRQLVNAVALNSATMNLSSVVGPGAAGIIIAVIAGGDTSSHFGVGIVFLVNATLFLIAVLAVARLKHRGLSTIQERGSIRGDMGAGLRYIWSHVPLRSLILMTFIPMLFGYPVQSLMPVFNHDVLRGGPDTLGWLLSAIGLGAILGSIILARFSAANNKGKILFVIAGGWAVFLGGFALSNRFDLALSFCVLIGLTGAIFQALHMSLITLIVSQQMRGRVMSVLMMCWGLMPLGVVPVSLVAQLLGIDIALAISAFALAALTVLMRVALPSLWTIDHALRITGLAARRQSPEPDSSHADSAVGRTQETLT